MCFHKGKLSWIPEGKDPLALGFALASRTVSARLPELLLNPLKARACAHCPAEAALGRDSWDQCAGRGKASGWPRPRRRAGWEGFGDVAGGLRARAAGMEQKCAWRRRAHS